MSSISSSPEAFRLEVGAHPIAGKKQSYCQQLIEKIEALGIPEPKLRNGKEAKAESSVEPNITN